MSGIHQRAFKCVNCGFVFHNWTTVIECIVCHDDVEEIEWDLK